MPLHIVCTHGMQTAGRVVNGQNMRDFETLQLISVLAVLIITYVKTRKHLQTITRGDYRDDTYFAR